MRALRIMYVLLSGLIFFTFINNAAGKIFPPSKVDSAAAEGSTTTCESLYSTYSYTESSSTQSDAAYQAYQDCLDKYQQQADSAQSNQANKAIQDQARNVYVVFGVLIIVLAVVGAIFRRLPLLSSALLLGSLLFTLYFPASNVVSSWYSSVTSSTVSTSALDTAILITSSLGTIILVLYSIFVMERKDRPTTTPPLQ